MSQGQISLFRGKKNTWTISVLLFGGCKPSRGINSGNAKTSLFFMCQKALWNFCFPVCEEKVCVSPSPERGRKICCRSENSLNMPDLTLVNHGCDNDSSWWAEGAAGTWLKEEEAAACFTQWNTQEGLRGKQIILLHYLKSSLLYFGL